MESNPDKTSISQLLHYHKVGTEYIKKALSIDEQTNKKDDAINYYKLGIEEFLLGLSIDLKGEDKERGQHIQEKMESNLTMALDRVEVLNHNSPRLQSIKNRVEKARLERRNIGPVKPSTSTSKTAISRPSVTRPTGASGITSRPSSAASVTNNQAKKPTTTVNKSKPGDLLAAGGSDNSKLPLKDLLKLPNVDKKMVEIILDEIVEQKNVKFSDVVGQNRAKQALQELVILPSINPQLFTGLLTPLKGLLLFGPPGNGKTMLAKAAANEANCNFFNINSSSLTSKYVGEGEKLVRTLFAVARHLQPSIIFIDEIDSILSERKESEHEASRRLKTEFLSQFDGMNTDKNDRVLVMGATNRPFDLDAAALRRFPKRIYVGLPDYETRVLLISKLLNSHANTLTADQIRQLAYRTDGYSGSDLNSLATDAAYGPIREKSLEDLKVISKNAIRPINYHDFINSLSQIKVTPPNALRELENWNKSYGATN